LARVDDDLIIEELRDEVLIYDRNSQRAHCLGDPAARVWRACDGQTTADELGVSLGLDSDTVARALDELSGCDLLSNASQPNAGTTRRELTIRAVKYGGVATAAPLIYSIIGPIPEAAATPTIAFCAQFNNANGCGGCQKCSCGCCCCTPAGGTQKNCYPSHLCGSAQCGTTGCTSATITPGCLVGANCSNCGACPTPADLANNPNLACCPSSCG
jgi:hypothetical protein